MFMCSKKTLGTGRKYRQAEIYNGTTAMAVDLTARD
jgi:hypothetical protein